MGWRQSREISDILIGCSIDIQNIAPGLVFIQSFLGAGLLDQRSCGSWMLALGKWSLSLSFLLWR